MHPIINLDSIAGTILVRTLRVGFSYALRDLYRSTAFELNWGSQDFIKAVNDLSNGNKINTNNGHVVDRFANYYNKCRLPFDLYERICAEVISYNPIDQVTDKCEQSQKP